MPDYDLIVLGGGSGDMIFSEPLAKFRSAVVEPDRFGGTCLNRGCIPSKMFVVAADAARSVTEARRLGVHAHVDTVDWPAIRDRIFGRIDPVHDRVVAKRLSDGIDVYAGRARFVAPREIEVDGRRLTADRFVVATGSRPVIPDLPGLDSVAFHTSDTIMRLDRLPRSMIVLGGGFIAAEMGHVFQSFGAKVSIVQRGPRLLMAEDEAISSRFTELSMRRFDLHLDTAVESVAATADGVAVTLAGSGAVLEAEILLVATGRRPNTDDLGVAEGGLALDPHGHIVTDETYLTDIPGVWALGDCTNHFQLKHMANAEMRLVAHNMTHPESAHGLPSPLAPHAVFTDPQIASVGLTEGQAIALEVDHIVATRRYSDTAFGWALEDTTSFAKVVADRNTRRLLGAHIIGPNAALLIQPLVQGMMLGQTVDEIARGVIYIHPALTEVVEQVLLAC